MNQRSLWKLALLAAGALGAFAAHSRAQARVPDPAAPQSDLQLEAGADALSLYELLQTWAAFEGHTVTLSELARARLEVTRTGLSGSLSVPAARVRGLVEDLLLWNDFALSQVRTEEPIVFGIHDSRADDRHNARFLQLDPEQLAARPELAALLVETVAVAGAVDARQLTVSMRSLLGSSWHDAVLCTGQNFILLRGTAANVRTRLAWIEGADRAERSRGAGVDAPRGEQLARTDEEDASQRAERLQLVSAAELFTELEPLLPADGRLVRLELEDRSRSRHGRGLRLEVELAAVAADDLAAAREMFAMRARFAALADAELVDRGSLKLGQTPGSVTLSFKLDVERPEASREGSAAEDPELFVIEKAAGTTPGWRVESHYSARSMRGGRLEQWDVRPRGVLAPGADPVAPLADLGALFRGLESADGPTVVTSLRVEREAGGYQFRTRLSRVALDVEAPADPTDSARD